MKCYLCDKQIDSFFVWVKVPVSRNYKNGHGKPGSITRIAEVAFCSYTCAHEYASRYLIRDGNWEEFE